MGAILALLLTALAGGDGVVGASVGDRPNVQELATLAARSGPAVSFEIREITVGSPEWRGKLHPVAPAGRPPGRAPRSGRSTPHGIHGAPRATARPTRDATCVQAPTMIGPDRRAGADVERDRVTTTSPPSNAWPTVRPTRRRSIAFEPQVDKVHRRRSRQRPVQRAEGQDLLAKIVIEENRLVAIHTASTPRA